MKLCPFTYINANLSSDHGITAAKLVELVSIFAHAQGVTRVDLSGNLVSGSKYEDDDPYGEIEEYDTDVSGIEALSAIKIKSLIVRNCELGPKAITALSSILTTAGLERLDVLGNPMGDSVNLLIDVFLKTEHIRTICGLEEGAVKLNLSNRSLTPTDIKLLAADLRASRSTADVAEVDIKIGRAHV